MGTKKREPWCLILERHSGGNSNLTSPNLVYITLSCLKHKIFTVYDIFDLLEHNGKGKNKYKSYLLTLNLKFKFPAKKCNQESKHQGPRFRVPIISRDWHPMFWVCNMYLLLLYLLLDLQNVPDSSLRVRHLITK